MKKAICVGLSILCILIISYIIFTYFYLKHPKFDKALLHYDSSGVQKKIIAKLEKLSIPYEIDKQGYILYQSVDEKRIKEIAEEIKRDHLQVQPSISITTDEHRDYFLSLLKQANIPFKTKRLSDKNIYRVEWDLKYNDEVQQLKIEFYKGISGSRKPPKLTFSNKIEKEILLALLNEKKIPYKLIKSEAVKSISEISEVIEYDWPYYDEVQELRLKARRMMREKK
jgi:hypothetical protein